MTAPVTEIHDEKTLRAGIRPLVFPRSLAIVGASERNLRPIEGAHAGGRDVVLVNPNRTEIAGRPCVPSIAAAPFVPELALLLVSHARVVDALRDGLAAGVRSFIVPGVGAEAGADGPGLIAELGALAREAGAAFVGPNCMGVACPGGPSTWIGTVPDTFLPGHVAVVVQSGSVGDAFIACGPRIGFRCVVSSGGEASRDAADLLGFLVEDDGTHAIGLFLETVRRPGAFMAALERAAEREKPVVCLKVGRSRGRGARDAGPYGCAGRLGPGLLGRPPPLRSDRGGRPARHVRDARSPRPRPPPGGQTGCGSLRVGRGMCAPRRPG